MTGDDARAQAEIPRVDTRQWFVRLGVTRTVAALGFVVVALLLDDWLSVRNPLPGIVVLTALVVSLRAAHARAVESGDKRRDFKTWLTSAKKARFTTDGLRAAALDTPVPGEIGAFSRSGQKYCGKGLTARGRAGDATDGGT